MFSPRRAALREATAEHHRQVDALIEKANSFGSLTAYGDHLRRMHLFHQRLECQLSRGGPESALRWRVGERVKWLREDLKALVVVPLQISEVDVSREPLLASAGHCLGALYVLIGSELGAAFLVKRLAALGVSSERGGRYLTGLASSRMWPDFLCDLEGAEIDPEADLIAGATDTFDFLIDHLGELQGA